MPEDYRVTIRLSPELYTQVAATRQPMAALVRHALETYLETTLQRQPDTEETLREHGNMLAAMAATITTLQEEIASLKQRVDRLAAFWQPPAATLGSHAAATRQPQDVPQDTPQGAPHAATTFDAGKFVLGKLCARRHDYQGTGQSLLRKTTRYCRTCDLERQRERREAKRQQP